MMICKESKFNPGARYTEAEREGSYERNGNRIINLGLNMYEKAVIVNSTI